MKAKHLLLTILDYNLNNDNVDNTQVAEVEPKDITASKMSGFKNQDYNSFKNQQDLFWWKLK